MKTTKKGNIGSVIQEVNLSEYIEKKSKDSSSLFNVNSCFKK